MITKTENGKIIVYAAENGVVAGEEVGASLNALLAELAAVEGEKELIFQAGEYRISSDTAPSEKLYITNSMGDDEWLPDETPHLNAIGLYFKGVKNLTVKGNGARFLMDGTLTNAAICDCKDIVLHDISLGVENPNMHCFTVTAIKPFAIDFELDEESRYICENGEYYFVGKDYKRAFFADRRISWWEGHTPAGEPDTLERIRHPFAAATKLIETAPYQFRASYVLKPSCKVGDIFSVFDRRRHNAGIFVDNSADIALIGVEQTFNYGLAYVAQRSENLTIDGARFAPCGSKIMASEADFMQVCLCRGKFVCKNGYFKGAGDDCLNVHGFHFKVDKIEGNHVYARFGHAQAHGFNPFRDGDRIDFVSPATLLSHGSATVVGSAMQDEYVIRLQLDSTDGLQDGDVVENVSACPTVLFENNFITRISTRGILLTTRSVTVRNNDFDNTSMNSILLSDDAKYWFESGAVSRADIVGNTFNRCPKYNVCVMPENKPFKNAVHDNILIAGNTNNGDKGGYYIQNSDNVRIIANRSKKTKERLKVINSQVEYVPYELTPEQAAEQKKKKKETLWQAIKYAMCTASAGLIEFLTYLLFMEVLPIDEGRTLMFLDPNPLNMLVFVSEVCSLALSVIWNFTLNRRFTFKSAENVPKAMTLAFLFYVPFFPFAAWYVPRLAVYIGIGAKISKMLMNGVLEFMWQKFVIYGKSANTNDLAKKKEAKEQDK